MSSRFHYKAAAIDGQTVAGVLSAENMAHALESLASQDLFPLTIEEKRSSHQFSLLGFFRGSHYENLITFTSSLCTMYRAGVPLLRALSIIRIGPAKGRFNQIIDELRDAVASGKSLSRAMQEYDDVFSKVYVSTIAAGEESGHLDDILEQLARVMEQELDITRQIKAGLRYPMIVLGVLLIAALAMLLFVIPRFVAFYGALGAELPLPTRILLGASTFLSQHWYYIPLIGVTVFFGARFILKRPDGRLWVDTQLLKIPVVGQLIVKGNISRFALLFRILYSSGLPIVHSLTILTDAIKNSAISAEIQHMGQLFREGKDGQMSEQNFRHIPPFTLHLIAIGLESGALDRMLEEIGRHYAKQVDYTSRQLTSIIEPILTLIMGGFVLLMALAIFLPMWNLIKAFQ